MLLNLRDYQRPGEGAQAGRQRERLDQALALLARPNVRTAILAGGDTLLGSADPAVQAVVDLQGLGLDQVAVEGGRLRIGAMVTRAGLAEAAGGSGPAAADLPGLGSLGLLLHAGARRWGGSAQRNRATAGGAVAVGAPNDPLLVALLACDAAVALYSEDGAAEVSLAEFLPSRAEWLAAPSLITDILVALPAAPEPKIGGGMAAVGRTPADAPIVVAAAVLGLHGGRCETVRLALGGVAPGPVRLGAIEERLAGRILEDGLLQVTAAQISGMVQPAGDFRGSAEYRRTIAGVLSERALREAWERAQ